ncbi:hypothetical protein HaLaN_00665 [Haematococcus lacustris]|uniref:Uncharacterized protein n=1 Tax=Haematococcus lacustris TaxID=44745 RepID=A0A699YSL4_HAELA|nr:hypothetical protein HaLaN_00665 [Haematococcus lacustris]
MSQASAPAEQLDSKLGQGDKEAGRIAGLVTGMGWVLQGLLAKAGPGGGACKCNGRCEGQKGTSEELCHTSLGRVELASVSMSWAQLSQQLTKAYSELVRQQAAASSLAAAQALLRLGPAATLEQLGQLRANAQHVSQIREAEQLLWQVLDMGRAVQSVKAGGMGVDDSEGKGHKVEESAQLARL